MEHINIRKILESIENINESTGLAGRKPGDTFKDPASGETLTFQKLQFYPGNGGTYSKDDLSSAVAEIEQGSGKKIEWENSQGARTGGFAVAEFTSDSSDSPILVGTYLQNVKANPVDNYISNTVLGKYKFAGKAAAKTQAGLTPQDLLDKKDNLTVSDIMNQLATKLGTDNPLYHVAHHVAMGQPLPLEINAPEGVSFTAFRDYFCEILQPIALHKGLYSGNAGEAAAKFLAPRGFPATTINFDDSKNAGLADSRLELQDGRYVKVSSKGDKGAEASVKNLNDSIAELNSSDDIEVTGKLRKSYGDVFDLLAEVQEAGQSGAPLALATKYDLIDASEAQIIRGLKGLAPVDLDDTSKLKSTGLTSNLISIARSRVTKNPESTVLYYHLIASLAHKVADIINRKTNFSDAASAVLNNGALVQVYTKARETAGGKKWILEDFVTVYPGTSVTGVLFSAQKNYSSTSIKGNFTFKILRGASKPSSEGNVDNSTSPTPDVKPDDREKSFNPLKDKSGDSGPGAGRKRR